MAAPSSNIIHTVCFLLGMTKFCNGMKNLVVIAGRRLANIPSLPLRSALHFWVSLSFSLSLSLSLSSESAVKNKHPL